MKIQVSLSMILICFFCNCRQEIQTESPEVIKQVLFDFYDGVKNKDFDMIVETTSPEFIAFIDGKRWSVDSMIQTLKSYPPFLVEYSFDDFNTSLADSLGCINYFVRGDFIFDDTLELRYDWLESATFTKVNDQWKMNFMHTTTIE